MRMRTIDQTAAYITESDPCTALTKTAIRRLVVTGALPSVRVGTKYLVSLEAVDAYMEHGNRPIVTQNQQLGEIRPISIVG